MGNKEDPGNLSERKSMILQAIIDEYINTAEPVGSRVISKKNELGLSSATIRNEMADLEEMGYLIQPHTSSGRVPSDSGYRFYVNSLMTRYKHNVEKMESLRFDFEKRVTQLEMLVNKMRTALSSVTDYTTVITTPDFRQSVIKKIDLLSLSPDTVLLIIVTADGVVKNKTIRAAISEKEVSELCEIINSEFSGVTAEEISYQKISSLREKVKTSINPKTLIEILGFIYQTIETLDETEVYIDNATSILKYPEYNDLDKARKMFGFLENPKNLGSAINRENQKSENSGVSVTIGSENNIEELRDCSLVTVNYSVGGKAVGKIGIVGPKRMDYAKVIRSLESVSAQIDKILNEIYSEGE
ncbi:MAG: heat-inducible transcription repressor HrcA [Oscillospiraceae bacterium]|nr:heat-inducible transcription repressor HrcA [Oscillospiraceae bacterium]